MLAAAKAAMTRRPAKSTRVLAATFMLGGTRKDKNNGPAEDLLRQVWAQKLANPGHRQNAILSTFVSQPTTTIPGGTGLDLTTLTHPPPGMNPSSKAHDLGLSSRLSCLGFVGGKVSVTSATTLRMKKKKKENRRSRLRQDHI
jgi:hypothetical protein